MKFSIVTPCRNAGLWIGDTVRSIVAQTVLSDPDCSIDYVIVDGASTDNTLEEARAAWTEHPRATMTIISEPDDGMYDALAKGLRQATGETISYLNAGDYYAPNCLEVVRRCRNEFGADWLTGMRVAYNTDGAVISARVPWRYTSSLILEGRYGIHGRGRFIQQESTFWSYDLMRSVDLERLSRLTLAGDLFLWYNFAKHARLAIVSAHLGGFRYHGEHLSEDMNGYRTEALEFLDEPRLRSTGRAAVHEIASWIPVPFRRYIPGAPPVIWWDPGSMSWKA